MVEGRTRIEEEEKINYFSFNQDLRYYYIYIYIYSFITFLIFVVVFLWGLK